VKMLRDVLVALGLAGFPGFVSEDASVVNRRIDHGSLVGRTAEEVWAHGIPCYGFTKPVVVHSVGELEAVFADMGEIATFVYVYTWVPAVKHAAHVPFVVVPNNNTFKAEWVWEQWSSLHEHCAQAGLLLAGHVSDGDGRLRECMFRLTLRILADESWCSSSIVLHHWLFEVSPHSATYTSALLYHAPLPSIRTPLPRFPSSDPPVGTGVPRASDETGFRTSGQHRLDAPAVALEDPAAPSRDSVAHRPRNHCLAGEDLTGSNSDLEVTFLSCTRCGHCRVFLASGPRHT